MIQKHTVLFFGQFWPNQSPFLGNLIIQLIVMMMAWYGITRSKSCKIMKMIMQNHAKIMQNLRKSCNFCKIMHKSIMKNHEKLWKWSCKIMQKLCKISQNHAISEKSCTRVSSIWPAQKIMKNDLWYTGVNSQIEARSISNMSILGILYLQEMWEKTYVPHFPTLFLTFFIKDIPKEHFRVENSLRQLVAKFFSQKVANLESKKYPCAYAFFLKN